MTTPWIEWCKIALQIVTILVAGIGLYFTTRQLRLLRASYVDSHDWNRRKAAQDAIEKYSNIQDDTAKLQEKFRILESNDPIGLDLIRKECEGDPTLRVKLHRRLNFFEFLAVGCNQGVLDEQVVGNAFKPVFVRTLSQFQPYIEHRRNAGAQGAWSQFEALAKKWRSELELERPREQTGGCLHVHLFTR